MIEDPSVLGRPEPAEPDDRRSGRRWREFDLTALIAFLLAACMSFVTIGLVFVHAEGIHWLWQGLSAAACATVWTGLWAWRRGRYAIAAASFFLSLAWPLGFAVVLTGPVTIALTIVSAFRAIRGRSTITQPRARSRSGEEASGIIWLALGLIAMGFLLVRSDAPTDGASGVLRALAFGLMLTFPGIVALLGRRRPALYLAAAVAGPPLNLVLLSILAVPFLVPAGMALAAYAQRSADSSPRVAAPVIALLALVLGIASFGSILVHEDPRCRTFENGITCSSDIVTPAEALISLGFTSLAIVTAWILAKPKPHPTEVRG